jgi:hypothetical protein
VLAVIALALTCAGGSSAAHALPLPSAKRCPVFPKTNVWNQRIDRVPVTANSAAIMASIGLDAGLHADFGSGLWEGSPIGIPFDVVTRSTLRSRVAFEYSDESDHVRYPIPKRVHIEGGSDHHALLLDRSACRLYELGGLERQNGRWHAWAGATWSLRSNRLRPAGWTSADAAGLPILPGLARYDEVCRGVIDHALRFTVQRTRRAYVYPAQGLAATCADQTNAPADGQHLQLAMSESEIDALGVPAWKKTILKALARYGAFVGDTGGNEAFTFEFESGSTYTSFGVEDPMVTFARAQSSGVSTSNGKWYFDLASGVNWASRLRVLDPCVSQGTC